MKKRSDTPPKLADRILRRALEKTDREHVLGDFQEFFEHGLSFFFLPCLDVCVG